MGTYVEGIKEEVVLSPAHALSLIAAGEEHRHVGSNNFNLLSSRSHTIFTLTIESSSHNAECNGEEATLSQLNLIDLAGSESSKTETTGLRRKEGSYINKSLLTLGTVVAKLSEGKASHVPYRDSKLTRLLQSSLSGHGRVSLICTITPASSNAEETHNTIKFAQRAKRVEIRAAPNRVLDEKSLIRKYQKEILSLKLELDHLRRGILDKPYLGDTKQDDLINLRQQLEAGQVKMQSRLEEEEQAKAALMGRIQKLTKLILVSTKNSIPTTLPSETPIHQRRHSFGDEQKNENVSSNPGPTSEVENSPNASPGSIKSTTSQLDLAFDSKGMRRQSFSFRVDESTPINDSFPESTQAGELFSGTACGRRPPPTGETMADQMDLLREQLKMLAGEVAFCTSSLKRMSEQAASNPVDTQLQTQMQRVQYEIHEKKRQIQVLEQRIIGTGEASLKNASRFEMSQINSKLMAQLNEKTFELEIRAADNRILEEQLQAKISENDELQESIASLQKQLATSMEKRLAQCNRGEKLSGSHRKIKGCAKNAEENVNWLSSGSVSEELQYVEDGIEVIGSESKSCNYKGVSRNSSASSGLQSQILLQAAEIEKLKQEKTRLVEEKGGLHLQSQKLGEEASYAKELASAAAVELKNLAEEVTKLSFQNAKLANDLVTAQELAFTNVTRQSAASNRRLKHTAARENQTDAANFMTNQVDPFSANGGLDMETDIFDIDSWELDSEDFKREIHARNEREAGLEAALADKEQVEEELHKRLEEAKRREAVLENDLAGMWVLVANLRKEGEAMKALNLPESNNCFDNKPRSNGNNHEGPTVNVNDIKVMDSEEGSKMLKELRSELEEERRKGRKFKTRLSQLKSEELDGLNLSALEDLQTLHMEALTKLCQAKARLQERLQKEKDWGLMGGIDLQEEERNGHICKVCFEAPTAAVLLPCRHFCLCKPCAVACTECPLCRSGIADRIITFTS